MGAMLDKVVEVERAVKGVSVNREGERGGGQKGLIETDFNPAGDIRESYIWGLLGGRELR